MQINTTEDKISFLTFFWTAFAEWIYLSSLGLPTPP